MDSGRLPRPPAGLPAFGSPPDPVPVGWYRDYLDLVGISARDAARILGHPTDRTARRWKAGKSIPWAAAELLAAWADGRPPQLEPP